MEVITTWARKKIITEQELEVQLLGLGQQESATHSELKDKKLLSEMELSGEENKGLYRATFPGGFSYQ